MEKYIVKTETAKLAKDYRYLTKDDIYEVIISKKVSHCHGILKNNGAVHLLAICDKENGISTPFASKKMKKKALVYGIELFLSTVKRENSSKGKLTKEEELKKSSEIFKKRREERELVLKNRKVDYVIKRAMNDIRKIYEA